MPANIRDRASIERIYPRAIFEREAQANTRAKAEVLEGVRILSAPDATGAFKLVRASHHVGEVETGSGSGIFVCPFAHDGPMTRPQARQDALAGVRGDYDAFIDKIIATARAAHFDAAPGPGDRRLRGLRQ